MAIPKFLYKYHEGSARNIATLSDSKLYFSHPANFNDPFDCALEILVSDLSPDAAITALRALIANGAIQPSVLDSASPEEIKNQLTRGLLGAIKTGRDAIKGVCCFAERPDDLLMWGHYGDRHRGVCLEFDTEKDALFKKAHPVKYSDNFPRIDLDRIARSDPSQTLELVLTKAKCWEYEKEWRVLHNEADLLYSVDRASLSKVYFGAKMPEAQQQMVAALLDNTDTKLARMRLDKSTFKLVAEEITFKRIDYRQPKGSKPAMAKKKKKTSAGQKKKRRG